MTHAAWEKMWKMCITWLKFKIQLVRCTIIGLVVECSAPFYISYFWNRQTILVQYIISFGSNDEMHSITNHILEKKKRFRRRTMSFIFFTTKANNELSNKPCRKLETSVAMYRVPGKVQSKQSFHNLIHQNLRQSILAHSNRKWDQMWNYIVERPTNEFRNERC